MPDYNHVDSECLDEDVRLLEEERGEWPHSLYYFCVY